jgi:hypothetical protein
VYFWGGFWTLKSSNGARLLALSQPSPNWRLGYYVGVCSLSQMIPCLRRLILSSLPTHFCYTPCSHHRVNPGSRTRRSRVCICQQSLHPRFLQDTTIGICVLSRDPSHSSGTWNIVYIIILSNSWIRGSSVDIVTGRQEEHWFLLHSVQTSSSLPSDGCRDLSSPEI